MNTNKKLAAIDRICSVVIPFFNGNNYINETISSILQNKPVAEIIIVVDKNSEEPLIESSSNIIRILYNTSNFKGAGIARSIGFNSAKYEYVAFLDSDDLWSPLRLEKHIKYMKKKDYVFSFHDYWNFNENGKKLITQTGPYNLDGFLKKSFVIGCLTVLIHKSRVPFIKGNTLKKRNDYLMWFELINFLNKNNFKWGGANFTDAHHRLHKDSLTHSKLSSAIYYYKYLGFCNLSFTTKIKCYLYYILNTLGNR